MSQMATEAPAPGKRENVFTRKIGPLPMWVWVVIVGGAIVAYSLYKRKTAGSTTTASPTGTDASQVPQFVNQTFTNPTAPVAGPPGPAGPPGATGPTGTKGAPGPPATTPVVPVIPGPKTPPRPHPNAPGVRSERLRHKGNIMQIAKRNGIDVEDLLEANPELQKYKGTGRMLPVGTVVRIPSAAA